MTIGAMESPLTIFSSGGKRVYPTVEYATMAGWVDEWDFGGSREEVQALANSYLYQLMDDRSLLGMVRRILDLIRLRNLPMGLGVPSEVGCVVRDCSVWIVYRNSQSSECRGKSPHGLIRSGLE